MTITNLILVAVLNHCTQFAEKLNIPLDHQLTTNDVQGLIIEGIYPTVDVYLKLANGAKFEFGNGHVFLYWDPKASESGFPTESDYKDPAVMSQSEALAMARQTVLKLGYSLKDFYMDLDPEVERPFELPYYKFSWFRPNADHPGMEIEIDAAHKKLVYFHSGILIIKRDRELDIPGLPELIEAERRKALQGLNPGYPIDSPVVKDAQVLEELPKIKDFAQRLGLAVHGPSTMSDLKSYEGYCSDGAFMLSIELTNGLSFESYLGSGIIRGFEESNSFFKLFFPNLDDYPGEPKISEKKAIAIVTNAVLKIYEDLGSLFKNPPRVFKPNVHFQKRVPRIEFYWTEVHGGLLEKSVMGEVDTSQGRLVRLRMFNWTWQSSPTNLVK